MPPALHRYLRCPACSTPGHHDADPGDAALDAAAAREMRQRQHDDAVARWRDSLPDKFRDATSNDPWVLDRFKRIRSGRSAAFVIVSDFGMGKTWLAMALLNRLIGDGIIHPSQVLWGSEDDLLGSVARASFADMARQRQRLLSPRWRIVFIDDVGHGVYPRPESRAFLWHALTDHLWSRNRSIIITTNHDVELRSATTGAPERLSPLEEYIGKAAFSRLLGITPSVYRLNRENMRRTLSHEAEAEWQELSSDAPRAAAPHADGDRPTAAQESLLDS